MPETLSPIQAIDLASERAFLGPALEEALMRVLASGQYVLGPEVERLEQDFAKAHGAAHGIGVASGTDALILGLKALGVGPGDRVVTSPFTFFASAAAIRWIGAEAVLADVDPDTALLDPRRAGEAIDAKTRCIVPVHLYGQLADMAAFRALADEHSLTILEDGAQAHGARRDGLACGALGDAGTFSFYPTKNLGAAGEGGLLVTGSDALAQRLRTLRDHGMAAKYVHAEIGTNSRLQALQAAVLNVKLPHLEAWNARRRAIARIYDEAFAQSSAVVPLRVDPGVEHAYHQYTVRIRGARGRDEVQRGMAERRISTAVHYPAPVHLQDAARSWGYRAGAFPAAETLAAEVLCLPVHPFLADPDAQRVARELLELAGSRS